MTSLRVGESGRSCKYLTSVAVGEWVNNITEILSSELLLEIQAIESATGKDSISDEGN